MVMAWTNLWCFWSGNAEWGDSARFKLWHAKQLSSQGTARDLSSFCALELTLYTANFVLFLFHSFPVYSFSFLSSLPFFVSFNTPFFTDPAMLVVPPFFVSLLIYITVSFHVRPSTEHLLHICASTKWWYMVGDGGGVAAETWHVIGCFDFRSLS
jgi:hypothetical protein